jgi:hypothetical protein
MPLPSSAPGKKTRAGSLEIWIHPRAEHPWGKQIEIPVELWTKKSGWTEYATNILHAQ